MTHPLDHTETSCSYHIIADAACDMPIQTLESWHITLCDMTYTFGNEDTPLANSEAEMPAFYERMRKGDIAHTAAISPNGFMETFRNVLAQGGDVVYVGFSSGISSSCDNARLAALLLASEYPNQHVHVVDSLCISTGCGLLLYLAVQKRDAGATAQELVNYLDSIKGSICHLFTVDTLEYLKRGGRVSSAAAAAAGALHIKPVMHVDDAGKLTSIGKAHGRAKAIADLATRFGSLALNPQDGIVFMNHSDCLEDARSLAGQLKERYGVDIAFISEIGPVIGSHCGPGTLALFFLAHER